MKRVIKSAAEVQVAMQNRTDAENAAMEVMKENEKYQDDPMVGIFWYDWNNAELFGVRSMLSEDAKWYSSQTFHKTIRTEPRLHKQIWQREYHRDKDKRFKGDYTIVPRGRVFEFEGEGFKVYTGDWIDEYPEVKPLILDEFQLPLDNTEFVKDIHWDIGHGWSDTM